VRVLIVEDDPAKRDVLERGLREELVRVEGVPDGTIAEARATAEAFDAILLDVVLPDHDGFMVCRRVRARGIDTPILLLTGRQALDDRMRGLDPGADDYLGKPFRFDELLARLRAVTRRVTTPPRLRPGRTRSAQSCSQNPRQCRRDDGHRAPVARVLP
jgi:DNA-binding response OmpR family regulator